MSHFEKVLNVASANRLFLKQLFGHHFDRVQMRFVAEGMLRLVEQPLLKPFQLTLVLGPGLRKQAANLTKILGRALGAIPLRESRLGHHSSVKNHDFVFQPILGPLGSAFLNLGRAHLESSRHRIYLRSRWLDRNFLDWSAKRHSHHGVASFVIRRRNQC